MMGNMELAPEVDASSLDSLLSPHMVSELLDTYMSTLTVSAGPLCSGLSGTCFLSRSLLLLLKIMGLRPSHCSGP